MKMETDWVKVPGPPAVMAKISSKIRKDCSSFSRKVMPKMEEMVGMVTWISF